MFVIIKPDEEYRYPDVKEQRITLKNLDYSMIICIRETRKEIYILWDSINKSLSREDGDGIEEWTRASHDS